MVVHHLSKRQDYDDHLDAVSSSTGFTGAADTILILANGPQGPTLYGKGRDIEDIETALRFHRARGLWTALGDATEVRRTDERKAILDALRESCDPLSPFQGPVPHGLTGGASEPRHHHCPCLP